MSVEWFEDDELWHTIRPVLFSRERLSSAATEVEDALKQLCLHSGASVLDLCCGVGRHTLELARRGYKVTAVDRTKLYLEEAKKVAERKRLGVEFVESDMRSFCRPNSFDGAICLFTSFGYFENEDDDRVVAQNLYRSLRPGATLVLDSAAKEIIARSFEKRCWSEADGVLLLEERKITREWSWIENTWTVVPPEGSRKEFRLSLRLYSARELSSLFRDVGFSEVRCYGSMDLQPFDNEAKRLIMVAKR